MTTGHGAVRPTPLAYAVWGEEHIDAASRAQMDNAMRLPVSVAGALMPDAHVGYGLPIGGVLATVGAVIPYAVGVDIACRMRLSVFDAPPNLLDQQEGRFEKALRENTRFGAGAEWKPPREDPILDDPDWRATPLLRHLKETKGIPQLGTSGSGNHFVEFGQLEVVEFDPQLGLQPGTYLALLSHSGSRGVGFQIADHYSKLARQLHPELGKDLAHLAWLDMDSEAGQEYWVAMNLAGRFASANHRIIHKQIAKAAGLEVLATVENHHNFAWEETLPDGRRVYVHRKGATPAGKGVLGVIPGTMGDVGYVVRGKGNPASLNSASHGAGRQMSRNEAFKNITKKMRDAYLRERGVKLLGGGLDEAPQAYKNINEVMAAQSDLVDIIARFKPRLVMMTDDPRDI
ncbi:MAG: RtcB family protein [Chloroflexi bacterium]|uniref:3'-phosphate/5'-hydroxy nucleic acid ligase n=1 Tax=Candidatus Thermofonsia Clade 3 bacterium TaxID=2364212 RepID=A0A2M8QCI0_9CHLR|nr:RtcB family protein [Candidatus Roseilinea sp. NK_OTU-006]PJF47504.1 MAG: RNA-splicing ligase RtcB [Candidatus Thermofonsia Clade 3 bacterium]RMG62807.1 MAG: RtcB family protein [Chloroflexota bacterium]